MSGIARLQPAERRDLLADLLALEPGVRVETARDGFLFVRFPEGVAARFYWYPYPLADPLEQACGFAVAAALDLGLMKLGALISRGARRDFVDLWALTRRLPLDEMLGRAAEKFGHVGDFPLQAAKALADFSEAEDEPMPGLDASVSWAQVRSWAAGEASRLGREVLVP